MHDLFKGQSLTGSIFLSLLIYAGIRVYAWLDTKVQAATKPKPRKHKKKGI